ncbi:hypothetical protein [Convivina praedatoris]|uniref:Secreted protein n=1 Tax=Convivina praedatoris TaxID=2880963 RepID=A0ABM9D2Z7_9LACO|nr:hypothetical protein [Convivina sp. LMG 32447]CAH1855859.1 hypothetical protein R077815_01293 [Convivina sp. LMG 32447]CAH1856651.1 hypothetical protein LMG032447_01337 [Convivina sp. LMG 32447]CAH1856832.1 hypothetical protein R078138_01446 [Convivina sp. LMG 32447]
MKKKLILIILLVLVAIVGGFWLVGNNESHKTKGNQASQQSTAKTSSATSSSAKQESTSSTSSSMKQSSSAMSSQTANPISLPEAQQLAAKVGAEWPSDNQKILSQNGNKTVIGGGIGAKGYDVITYEVDDNQVKIHEVFGTMDSAGVGTILGAEDTGAHPIDYMQPKDYTVQR